MPCMKTDTRVSLERKDKFPLGLSDGLEEGLDDPTRERVDQPRGPTVRSTG